MMTAMGRVAPRLSDRYMETVVSRQQRTKEPSPRGRRDSLYRPQKGKREEEGDYPGHVAGTSLYTHSVLHPMQAAMAVGLLGAGIVIALRGNRPRE